MKHQCTGMILVISYFALLAANSLIIFLAHALFPQFVVLGTAHIPVLWAGIHSMGCLALLNTFTIPFVREYEKISGKMFSSKSWMILYFVENFIGLWIIARFAVQTGFGIPSWIVALVLAVVLDIIQGMVMMQLEKLRTKNK